MDTTGPIRLPLFQRFDCHSCTYCCRNLVVNVTEPERRRIMAAGWPQKIPDHPLFVAYRFHGRRLHRLAHRDGRCVFLGNDGRCRLHAETGVDTKPLACRLYPFVPTPGADGVGLDLRCDCPSVAANKGRSLATHGRLIAELAAEVGARAMSEPPPWPGARSITAGEFDAVVEAFDSLLRRGSLLYRTRLRAGAQLLELLYTLRVRRIRDERFVELMELLSTSAAEEGEQGHPPGPVPPRRASRLFGEWLFLHAVTDDPAALDTSLSTKLARSWRRYGQARRFARGKGPVPPMAADWPNTTFETVASVAAAPDDALEPVTRILRLKLQAHAFAGPAYFRYDLLSGLTALWLMPALVGWFGRLGALAAGRHALTPEDVLEGLRRVHHTYGVSPVFGRISERLRLRTLSKPGVPTALLAAYGP